MMWGQLGDWTPRRGANTESAGKANTVDFSAGQVTSTPTKTAAGLSSAAVFFRQADVLTYLPDVALPLRL